MTMQWENTPVYFEDAEVKRICVENFGGENGIINSTYGTIGVKGCAGEITYKQIQAVKSLGNAFAKNKVIVKFNEFLLFKNVKTGALTFEGCSALQEVSVPDGFVPSYSSFSGCTNLVRLNITNFGPLPYNCNNMFTNCQSLVIDINLLDMRQVGQCGGMFQGCNALKEVNTSNWSIPNLVTCPNLFLGCSNLEVVDFSGIKTAVKLRELVNVFQQCPKLKRIDFGNFNFSNVQNFGGLFANCGNLEELTNFDYNSFGVALRKDTGRYYNDRVFSGSKKLVNENFVQNKITKIKTIGGDFFMGTEAKYYDLRNWDGLGNINFAAFSLCLNFEGVTLPNNDSLVLGAAFFRYGGAYKFNGYTNTYIRFLSETPPTILNIYPNFINLNWYVPATAIDTYRDYIDSLEYFTANVSIKSLDEWEDDCDKFGWTKY